MNRVGRELLVSLSVCEKCSVVSSMENVNYGPDELNTFLGRRKMGGVRETKMMGMYLMSEKRMQNILNNSHLLSIDQICYNVQIRSSLLGFVKFDAIYLNLAAQIILTFSSCRVIVHYLIIFHLFSVIDHTHYNHQAL